MGKKSTSTSTQAMFVGTEATNPVYIPHKKRGAVLSQQRYISLDSTASTPPLKVVADTVSDYGAIYSSAHRGTGFKSVLCTQLLAQSREAVKTFVGLSAKDAPEFTVIYGKNTTEVLNIVAHQVNSFSPQRPKIVTSLLEHHSNDLPWRNRVTDPESNFLRVGINEDKTSPHYGQFDLPAYEALMSEHGDEVAVVSVTGASNTTGWITDASAVSSIAKAHGATMILDCAQLAPHRPIAMSDNNLDAITFCGHKMYAPYGTAVAVVRSSLLTHPQDFVPLMPGGGTIRTVLEGVNNVWYDKDPHASEGGSPNSVGTIALFAAINAYNKLGWDAIIAHEKALTKLALQGIAALNTGADLDLTTLAGNAQLKARKKIGVVGGQGTGDADLDGRLGVVCFSIDGVYHATVGAILGHEFGIGIRTGCFCAHPYVLQLIGMSPDDQMAMAEEFATSDKARRPGLCRASFGYYNTEADVAVFLKALQTIADGRELLSYEVSPEHGMVVNPVAIRKTGVEIEDPWNAASFHAAFPHLSPDHNMGKGRRGSRKSLSSARPASGRSRLFACFGL